MRARLPRIPVVAQVLLLAGQALGEDPSPAPEGFAWKRVESAKAWFLIPAGWYFKEESKSGTRAFFITQEDIDKSGEFIDLTRAEFKALSLLSSNPGKVLTRDRLLHEIGHRDWDPPAILIFRGR